ncbi:MAG: 50S ribosomal protein L1 [Omnitrophica bacterium RIFCSPLOWO2_12_FULL_50_11]|nr:MAG: 50S ribosomal protein L1 [Omnitrophica bacterium RIFCSPLOWO2_12_FULL_50_11]
MKRRSKRYESNSKSFDCSKQYVLEEAIRILKGFAPAKFDESVELNFRLGIRADQSNENVRGVTTLPHGTGKTVKVLCFAKGEAQRAAQAAGADYVGAEEYVKKVSEGWMDFDAVVAHPEMMRDISKLGKILGPRGLMPTPKTGTVTTDVDKTIREIKSGRIEFKSDKTAGLHVRFGRRSFSEENLLDNAKAAIRAVIDSKPSACKGDYIKRVSVASSQSPGIKLRTTSMTVVDG